VHHILRHVYKVFALVSTYKCYSLCTVLCRGTVQLYVHAVVHISTTLVTQQCFITVAIMQQCLITIAIMQVYVLTMAETARSVASSSSPSSVANLLHLICL
jgi:hypothetical protein